MEGDRRQRMVFPHTLTVDILSRLPVKSLLRFKCASNYFCNLISRPFFQDLHHTRSQRTLFFFFRIPDFDFNFNHDQEPPFSYRFATLETRGITVGKFIGKVDAPIKLVLPSCFGLVCFGTEKTIYLCNPATRKFIPLPPSRAVPIVGFGFGYLPSMRVFKVVSFALSDNNLIQCFVLTLPLPRGDRIVLLASGTWRLLSCHCPHSVDQFSYPAFANDTIYWKINHSTNNDIGDAYIVSMNLIQEKFGVVNRPSGWTHSTHRSTHLVEITGKLFLAESCASHVLLWMFSRNSIWVKVGTISLRGIDSTIVGEIKFIRKGQILFSSSANFLLFYDIHKKKFRQVQLPFPAFEFTVYSETLSFSNT